MQLTMTAPSTDMPASRFSHASMSMSSLAIAGGLRRGLAVLYARR